MTYQELVAKQYVAQTIFQSGVESALSVDIASNEQKLEWIIKDLEILKEKLAKYDAEFLAGGENIDPFADEVK